ncbi:MAG: hypothetical protein CVU52_04450 [Deltaproteobacteria bacterium HGW-Deltaproteobacteria-10]|nr:MAG: hypothetical protein CVU52_04450 [Deltaproteobacteria bacterium HGW-Deltaproteobacteria-10]
MTEVENQMSDNAFDNCGYNKKLKPLAGKLRRNMTKSEACLWKYALKARHLKGYQFRRQRPVLNYIADFICKELMLIIEIDGITHDAEDSLAKDKRREEDLNLAGFKVIRFTDEEVLSNMAGVVTVIEKEIERIEKSTPLIPRQRGTRNTHTYNGKKVNYDKVSCTRRTNCDESIKYKILKKNIAVFLDRDGTINEEVGYLDSLDKLKIISTAYEAIKLINLNGMKAIVISNQAGVARGYFSEDFVRMINNYLQNDMLENGAVIDRFYYCPHHPTEGNEVYQQICNCRKPAPGMLLQAAEELSIDLAKSYFVGDRFIDMETAKKVGAKGVLVRTGYGDDLLQDDGPDTATQENKPDFVAADILEAVQWILKDRKHNI